MVVASNPTDSAHEAVFTAWYTHPSRRRSQGCGLQRCPTLHCSATPGQWSEPKRRRFRYLAIYDVESDDLQQSGRDVYAALDSAIPLSETFGLTHFSVDFYAAIPDAERHSA